MDFIGGKGGRLAVAKVYDKQFAIKEIKEVLDVPEAEDLDYCRELPVPVTGKAVEIAVSGLAGESDMTTDAKRLIDRCAVFFDKIRKQEENELRKLCEDPTLYDVAQKLTDRLWGELTYLCNYKSVVNGYGKEKDIRELITEFQNRVSEAFKELTGKEYVPQADRLFKENVEKA